MIIINAAMLQDKLVEAVTAIENPKITFLSKKGMELQFESDDEETAAAVAKKTLKAMPEFKTVYFQIHVK
ncbi:MAG: hypothetical protein HFI38_05810 [Lachnospiraceae bacterium]|jgi:hypothetical protein|nr:hypothetical protein [Lachnospiraceae bacterium]